MQEKEIVINYKLHPAVHSLDNSYQNLWKEAEIARKKAYAPYSDFHVGAAVLLSNGHIVHGNNQENAAFPSGLCAERVALYYAKAQFPNLDVVALAVNVESETYITSGILSPCGACRQVLAEVRSRQTQAIKVFFPSDNEQIIELSDISALLPFLFSLKK